VIDGKALSCVAAKSKRARGAIAHVVDAAERRLEVLYVTLVDEVGLVAAFVIGDGARFVELARGVLDRGEHVK